MNRPVRASWATVSFAEERYRPFYARALGLRFVNPGGVLCFLFFEGTVALAVLLALAELVTWWAVLVLPTAVAAMVKLNDMVAEMVVRTAALVPEQERDRFRRQMEPVVGRAVVRGVGGGPGAVGHAAWGAAGHPGTGHAGGGAGGWGAVGVAGSPGAGPRVAPGTASRAVPGVLVHPDPAVRAERPRPGLRRPEPGLPEHARGPRP
ncbi:hypothetical protein C5N14_27855 [Micromonospora sp. MW-13]|nr:hypothetical protein C5N14_27855 [Micromonospora sp. MW-13]